MKLSSLKQKIEELDAKATGGPWDNEGHTWIYAKVPNGRPNGEGIATFRGEQHHGITREDDTANAAFTALSRTAMPELLRRLLVAEEALEHERTALSILHNRLRDGIATIGKEDLELGMKQLSAALKAIRGEEE